MSVATENPPITDYNPENPYNHTTFQVFSLDYEKVIYPLTAVLLILALLLVDFTQSHIKSITKRAKHWYVKWIYGIPESCLLMVFGVVLGLVLPREWFSYEDEDIFPVILLIFEF